MERNNEVVKEANQTENNLDVKDNHIASLKNASEELKIEIDHLKHKADTEQAFKSVKTKEKEVSRLQVKVENLSQTLSKRN